VTARAKSAGWRATAVLTLAILLLPSGARANEYDPFAGQTIQEIRIHGHRVTRDFVILREIWSEQGQPLDPILLAGDATRLENLSIFGSVEVTVTPGDQGVIVDFAFAEMPWLVPYPAGKWNEQNGFSVGAGLSSPNLLGRGVLLSTSVVFGGTTNVSFRGLNPWIVGDHLSVELLAYHSERDNTILDFGEKADRVEVTVGHYIGRFGRMSGKIGYWGMSSDLDGITLSPDGRDDMLVAGASLGYDSRDSWRVPHRGWNASLEMEQLRGSANTRTTTLDVTRYQPVAAGHTLAFGPLLSTRTGEVGSEIATYDQYFLGGSNSVRGYKVDTLGREIQGKNRFLATAEYRYLVLPVSPLRIFKWSIAVGAELAAFADVGVIWNQPEQFNLDRTRFGYGIGARVLFPVVEMVRFDIGVSEFGDIEFNFGVRAIFDARSVRIS